MAREIVNAKRREARARDATTPERQPRISVIVPVLNEESQIGDQLQALTQIPGIDEVIVVDGGSHDRTLNIVRAFPRVRVLDAPPGRSSQMNSGASMARGEILIFLHADVRLPANAWSLIQSTLADPGVVAGAFRTWTVVDREPTWLAPLLHLADLRSRYSALPYGDQALFVRAAAFRSIGGFPDQALMEDLELSRRLRRLGDIRTVAASVRVSGRRFIARPIHYTLLVNLFPLLYRFGVSPHRLARWYRHVR